MCRNEADKLAGCLASVVWAEDVVVMDLDSDDDSVAVAEANGARVVAGEPTPIVAASSVEDLLVSAEVPILDDDLLDDDYFEPDGVNDGAAPRLELVIDV